MSKYTEDDLREELKTKEYEYGFYTDLESETFPIGLNEDIVRAISKKKDEPQWMTDWRLEAFRVWQEMTEPEWANVHYEKPDFQAIAYYSAPVAVDPNKTLDDVDPDLLAMYKKLGISVDEQKKMNNIAMDIVVDSVSVATTFKETLAEKGIIFMSISEAIKEHPELVKKYIVSYLSVGEFYSIAVTNNYQQADTGTKMIHLGNNTKSTIISKGISAGKSQNSYRGLVQVGSRAENARNFS